MLFRPLENERIQQGKTHPFIKWNPSQPTKQPTNQVINKASRWKTKRERGPLRTSSAEQQAQLPRARASPRASSAGGGQRLEVRYQTGGPFFGPVLGGRRPPHFPMAHNDKKVLIFDHPGVSNNAFRSGTFSWAWFNGNQM